MAGHRLVTPQERSLELLTETDGDETMMGDPGDNDAVQMTREACRHFPYRDWCRACVGGTRRAHKGSHSVSGGENQAEYYDMEHACSM